MYGKGLFRHAQLPFLDLRLRGKDVVEVMTLLRVYSTFVRQRPGYGYYEEEPGMEVKHPERKKVLVALACGQTAEDAVRDHLLRFPEHGGPDYEISVVEWNDQEKEYTRSPPQGIRT